MNLKLMTKKVDLILVEINLMNIVINLIDFMKVRTRLTLVD